MDRSAITPGLASRLVAAQFPQWADLPIRPVELNGHDNITFRLGDDMSVRLPSGDSYVPQVSKEHRWLPELARHLPLPIPEPLARGAPGCGYPWPWSVYRWLDGEPAATGHVADLSQFAADLAGFLAALYQIDTYGGPAAGYDTCFFGVPLAHWDSQTRKAIAALDGQIETEIATEVWEAALAAAWHGPPVWFHGDVSPGNLLVSRGRLSAVIDFGVSGVGDQACDTAIAWTFFAGESRKIYRTVLPADNATWARGRGWALWKALITLVRALDEDSGEVAHSRRVIEAVLADHQDLSSRTQRARRTRGLRDSSGDSRSLLSLFCAAADEANLIQACLCPSHRAPLVTLTNGTVIFRGPGQPGFLAHRRIVSRTAPGGLRANTTRLCARLESTTM